MIDVTIGKGSMSGKGLYAARDFKKSEVVIKYKLKPITFKELKTLSPEDYAATHNNNGQIYLYPEPVRYVSHSENPNVKNDHDQQADIAVSVGSQFESYCIRHFLSLTTFPDSSIV